MKYIIALVTMCLLASPAIAQTRMRDYSLSPEESVQQPNISHQQQGGVPALGAQPFSGSSSSPISTLPNYPRSGQTGYNPNAVTPANSFMTGYCDPNFHPLVNTGNLQACFQAAQQQICQQFQALPPDVQIVIDSAANCVYSAANADTPATTDNCAVYDTNRLQLLKKYWQDQNTAYAILYLPDEVLNASAKCMRGGR